ncbi:winged helix DNA-binding protein [Streptomyces sp. M19]
MTQLIQRLERQGLVTRVEDPADRRAVLLAITDEGLRLLDARHRDRTARLTELLATLPPEDERALGAAVRAALPAFRRLSHSTPPPRTPPGDPVS